MKTPDLGLIRPLLRAFSGRPPPHPLYLILFVTSRCVGHCKHCFYWPAINQPERPLSREEADKTAASMGRLLQVTFTGGEPFLREDFVDLAEIFYRRNRPYHLGIATSGFHPERVEAGVKRLLASCPDSRLTVGLPLEGTEELNDEIRGVPGFFARTTETYQRLLPLRQASPRLTLLVDITASGFNRGRLRQTYEMIRDNLRPDVINLILTRGVPRDPAGKDLDPREINDLLALMEKDLRAGRQKGYRFFGTLLSAKDIILRRLALEIFQNHSFHFPCAAGRIAGVLMPEGEVFPCELWTESLGNVRAHNYSIPAIWSSEKARAIRREIIASKCTCYHQCFLSNSIFFNLREWPGLLKEWLLL